MCSAPMFNSTLFCCVELRPLLLRLALDLRRLDINSTRRATASLHSLTTGLSEARCDAIVCLNYMPVQAAVGMAARTPAHGSGYEHPSTGTNQPSRSFSPIIGAAVRVGASPSSTIGDPVWV